jgi:hypothetical protein
VELGIDILRFSSYLQKVTPLLDYSAIYAIVGMMFESVTSYPAEFSLLGDAIRILWGAISPTTGSGIFEIWSSFVSWNQRLTDSGLRRLDLLACRLEEGNNATGLYYLPYLRAVTQCLMAARCPRSNFEFHGTEIIAKSRRHSLKHTR